MGSRVEIWYSAYKNCEFCVVTNIEVIEELLNLSKEMTDAYYTGEDKVLIEI